MNFSDEVKDSEMKLESPDSPMPQPVTNIALDEPILSSILQADEVFTATAVVEEVDVYKLVPPEDYESLTALIAWLSKSAEIMPSKIKSYALIFAQNGLSSVSRLAKKMHRDVNFIYSVGINEDDADEILHMVKLQGHFKKIEDENANLMEMEAQTMLQLRRQSQQYIAPTFEFSVPEDALTVADIPPAVAPEIDHKNKLTRRRYHYYYSDKIERLIIDIQSTITDLKTAIDTKSEQDVLVTLGVIGVGIDKSIDKQRAYFRAETGSLLLQTIDIFVDNAKLVERALLVLALLCRQNDEVKLKASMSLESIKVLAETGACDKVIAALQKHATDANVIMAACDVIRCLSMIETNKVRIGEVEGCECLGRALATFAAKPEALAWLCRAIGHVASANKANKDRFGKVGTIETVVKIIQNNMPNIVLCAEACWAVRNLVPTKANRKRIKEEQGVVTIISLLKLHLTSEIFMIEAVRALTACIASEEDEETVGFIVNFGALPMVLKSLRRNIDSESLAQHVLSLCYYVSCQKQFVPRLISVDVLDMISTVIEKHASEEPISALGCNTVHKIAQADEQYLVKMRKAGLCEMIVSAVQRQAVSVTVSDVGCRAIGDLAKEKSNHSRLASSGACEAVTIALGRHDESEHVVFSCCHAIHYLASTPNNVELIRVNEGCEFLVKVLNKHTPTSITATQSAVRAIGSMALDDDGNQVRFLEAGVCPAVVTALRTHTADPFIAEYSCRAIFHLCAENGNVSDFGAKGACGLIVAALTVHAEEKLVVAQALLAVHALAVKTKNDKVHNGNTRKLVMKGVLECVIAAAKKFPKNEAVQRAAAMAIASLARLEANRDKLGALGACEVMIDALKTHKNTPEAVAQIALAMDVLSFGSESSRAKFQAAKVVGTLLWSLKEHEKSEAVVANTFRAFVSLQVDEKIRKQVRSDDAIHQYVKCLRAHSKVQAVAKWGCNLVYVCASDNNTRNKLGINKTCEAISHVMMKHSVDNIDIATLGCMAIVALCDKFDENKSRFCTTETCTAIVQSIRSHFDNVNVAEWGLAAIVTLCDEPDQRPRFGKAGVCEAITLTLHSLVGLEKVTNFACEAVYVLCADKGNRKLMGDAGISEIISEALKRHTASPLTVKQICKSITNLAAANQQNSTKLGAAGICELISGAILQHSLITQFMEWGCAAVATLSTSNAANQSSLGASGMCEATVEALVTHRAAAAVCVNATKAIRALCGGHADNSKKVMTCSAVPSVLKAMKSHTASEALVENGCWVVANIPVTADVVPAPPSSPISSRSKDPSVSEKEAVIMSYNNVGIYKVAAHWDLLVSLLEAHISRENAARWACAALGLFAEIGRLTHGPACDLIIQCMKKHKEKPLVLQKVLLTLGSLAECSSENQLRLGRLGCSYVDAILEKFYDNESVNYACLRAIAGLASQCPANQKKFGSFSNFCKTVVTLIYDEVETENISRWGCAAVSSLIYMEGRGHSNQSKLSQAASNMGDILETHATCPAVVKEALRAIAVLAHGNNVANRNRLGATDACEQVPKVLELYKTNSATDREIQLWGVRAIADLAANNPNNQTKLGQNGACEILVQLLQKEKLNAEYVTWVCWALGNIVQIKGSNMLVADDSTKTGFAKKNTGRLGAAGVAEAIVAAMRRHPKDKFVSQWGSRAINNMAKSKTLKQRLLRAKALDAVKAAAAAFADDKGVLEWVVLAKDTLEAANDDTAPSSPDERASPKRPSAGQTALKAFTQGIGSLSDSAPAPAAPASTAAAKKKKDAALSISSPSTSSTASSTSPMPSSSTNSSLSPAPQEKATAAAAKKKKVTVIETKKEETTPQPPKRSPAIEEATPPPTILTLDEVATPVLASPAQQSEQQIDTSVLTPPPSSALDETRGSIARITPAPPKREAEQRVRLDVSAEGDSAVKKKAAPVNPYANV